MARKEPRDEVSRDDRRPTPQTDPTNPINQEAVGN